MASGKCPVMPESLETQKKLVVLLHRLPVTPSTDPSHGNPFTTSRNGGKETQSSGLGGERETGESNSCSSEGSTSLHKTRLDQTRQKHKMIPVKDCPTVSFDSGPSHGAQCGLLVLHKPPHGSDIPSSNNNFSSCYAQRNTSSTSCENANTRSWADKNDPLASLCAYIGKKMKNINKTAQKNVKKVNPVSSTDCEHADNALTRGIALNRTSLGSDVSEHQECSEPVTAVSWKGGLCAFTDSKKLPMMYRQPGEPQKHKQRKPLKEGFVKWQQIGSSDTILSTHDPFIEDIQAADQQATTFSNFISEALDANVSNVSDPDPGSSPQSSVPGLGICGLVHPKDSCAPNLTACGTLGNGACNVLTLASEKVIQTHVGTGRHLDSERSKPIHFPTTTSTTGERFSVHPKSLIVTVRNMEASERQVLKRANSGSSVKNVTQSLRNNGCLYPSDGLEHTPDRPAEGDTVCQKNDQHRSISKDTGIVSHTSEGNKRKLMVTYPGKRLCTCNMSDPLHKTILKMTKCPCPGETGGEDQCSFCKCSKHGSDSRSYKTCCPAHRREMSHHTGHPVAPLTPVHVLRQKRLRIGKVYRNVPSFNYDGERMDNDKTYGTLHQGRKSPWHKKQASDVYRQVKLFKYTIGRITSKSLLFYLKHRKKRAVWASLPCKICMRMIYTKTFFRMPAPTVNLQHWPKLCFTRRRDTCLSCLRVKGSLTKTRTCAKEAHLCTECGKRFIQLDVLNLHQRSHSEAKLFVCSVCGRRFVQQALLLIHQKTHLRRKPHQCMDCGQTFHVKELFVAHQKTHRVEKPHCCTDCGKCFADRSTLLIHQRVHTGEKPFNCLDCGKSFSQHSTLVSHQRIHTGEKPFSCHDCGRQFGDRSAYASHRRTHTGEKPFKCEGCGKRFAQSSNLRRHERIHTGQKPYACAECGRTFNENTKLKAHLHVHLKKGN